MHGPSIPTARRALTAALLLANFGAGCSKSPATQVLVCVALESGARGRASEVHVVVEGPGGRVAADRTLPLRGEGAVTPPLTIPIVPRGGSASRTYVVRAELLDGSGTVFAKVRAAGSYVDEETRVVRLAFEDPCLDRLDCADTETCRAGACVESAAASELLVGPAGLACVASDVDAGVDAGADADVPADGGTDASVPVCGVCEELVGGRCEPVPDDTPCGCDGDRCVSGRCEVRTPVDSLSAGDAHTCATDRCNRVWCWGSDEFGQQGNGPSVLEDVATPTLIDGPEGFGWKLVETGANHTCRLHFGPLYFLVCWGDNADEQLGRSDVGALVDQAGVAVFAPGSCYSPSGGQDRMWEHAAGGRAHTCGIRFPPCAEMLTYCDDQHGAACSTTRPTGRELWCWGRNDDGQLGLGDLSDRPAPVRVGASLDWDSDPHHLAAGDVHTCAIDTEGRLYCWGNNMARQIGIGTTVDRVSMPTQVTLDGAPLAADEWARVTAGTYHTCALRRDGRLYCWGSNRSGQLGVVALSPDADADRPREVVVPGAGSLRFNAVAAGAVHTCARDNAGELWCWGSNAEGQLGRGSVSAAPNVEPVRVAGGRRWNGIIATGASHTCAVDADGALLCWGSNARKALGVVSGGTAVTTPMRACLDVATGC